MENIVCINAKNYALTNGRTYEVLLREGNYVIVTNDNGRTQRYYAELFQEPAIEQPVEEAQPVAPRTEADMIASIEVINSVTVQFRDTEDELQIIRFERLNTGGRASASCGIGDCSGINNICDAIDRVVDDLDDDYINLRKALLKAVLNYNIHQQPSADRAMYLISTAVEDISDAMIEALDEFSNVVTDVINNPNSGNDIKTWLIYKNRE